MNNIIAPSVLAADYTQLAAEIGRIEYSGADWLHVDIMDGHFVPNISFGPAMVAHLRRITRMPLDVHLMIENPEKYILDFAQAGADRISVHPESTPHVHRAIQMIREAGCSPGVALNPSTPLNAVDYVLHDIDLLLIMTVNPGFGGQVLIPQMIRKVEQARAMLTAAHSPALLEVDGGVNPETAPLLAKAGAGVLVAGSALFSSNVPAAVIARMKNV